MGGWSGKKVLKPVQWKRQDGVSNFSLGGFFSHCLTVRRTSPKKTSSKTSDGLLIRQGGRSERGYLAFVLSHAEILLDDEAQEMG
jgi:hypothetical protein